ncbi:hypothetical protein FDUTEX481_05711 [Tolypothrix sp. PCC 7601]|nr:hypothetical protein FDUTEX481_05711 [Tolypothrix sp. PCC 7601]
MWSRHITSYRLISLDEICANFINSCLMVQAPRFICGINRKSKIVWLE